MLARVSVPLAPALEHPEDAVAEVAGIVVPDLADLFVLDLVRPGDRIDAVVARASEPATTAGIDARRAAVPHWDDGIRRVLAAGASELTYVRPGGVPPDSDGHGTWLHGLGMQSWIVAPLVVRGAPHGTITVAVGHRRRGLRPSDRTTVDDLAARCSIAFERGLLYGEAREAARTASEQYEAARLREARLQALVEASPLAILELDAGGGIQLTNPRAASMFSGDGGDGPMRLPQPLVDHLVGRISERASDGTELVVQDGGERQVLRVSSAPVRAADGAPLVLAVIADVTGRKALEDQLLETQRYEAIAGLAGGIAHDFNNLLTVIVGYSEMLLRTLEEGSSARSQVEAIHDAGSHAAVITNQLLALSRHQVVQPETVEPAARCAALLPMLRRLVGDEIGVEVRRAGTTRIRVDPGQLEQVVFNLVVNSRDATAAGGRIVVEAGEVVARPGGDAVCIRVIDDGAGMDAETLARSREPFFTTKGSDRGTGLGLATVVSILERSGGTFELESAPGVGTTASALFPPAPHDDPVDDVALPDPTAVQVLVVDDDDHVRGYATEILAGAGYGVAAVSDAEQALERLGAGDVDVLLSDVVLGGTDGFELVRRARERHTDLACLLMTGFAAGEEGRTGPPPGDVPVLAKPFTADALLTAVGAARAAITGP